MGILRQAGKLMFKAIFSWHRMIFPWAVFLFQFYNSCLYLFKFNPSVSGSFTLNSSAKLFCQRNQFQLASAVLLQNWSLSGKSGQGAWGKHMEKQAKLILPHLPLKYSCFLLCCLFVLGNLLIFQSYSSVRHALIFLLFWLLSICLLIFVTLKQRNKSPQKKSKN